MRHNLKRMMREELVKRFDIVVQEEIKRHDVAVEKSNRDISSLKDLFQGFKTELEKLKALNLEAFKETQDHFTKECKNQEEAFEGQRRYIKANARRVDQQIEGFKYQLNEFIQNDTFTEQNIYIDKCLETLSKKVEDVSKDQDEKLYKAQNALMYLLEKSRSFSDAELEKTNFSVELLADNLDKYRVDAKGILREIQVHKKTVFIMEKKIENLYTLIERLNKRIDS